MTMSFDKTALVKRYTPLLVLYPEIPTGTTRKASKTNDTDKSPLLYDYHPRDIRIVLQNSGFHARFRFWGSGKTSTWRRMLDRMQAKKYRKNLDLLPGVKADDRDKFWEEYARIVQNDENGDYKHACYARIVPGAGSNDDRLIVQYWYAYFYNDFWNAHEMDWECVMIVFKTTDEDPIPTICVCSAHHKGLWLPWSDVDRKDDTHPEIYVAHGSHAGYFYGPRKYLTAPEIVARAARSLNRENRGLGDFTVSRGEGTEIEVEAKLIPDSEQWREGEWRWLNQEGLWGSPGDWDLEFGDSGPKGPPQAGDKWDTPFRWINNTCDLAPPPEESQVPSRLEPGE